MQFNQSSRIVWLRWILFFSVFFFFFLSAEIFFRVWRHGVLDTENYFVRYHRELLAGCPSRLDPDLGWDNAPSVAGIRNAHGTYVSTAADGARNSGKTAEHRNSPEIVALGDSFTFGDQVNDSESWPAVLQERLKTSVWNGGVCGYGVDQMLLKAQKFLPILSPHRLVLSIFTDDIDRTQITGYSDFNGRVEGKPYFAQKDGHFQVVPPKMMETDHSTLPMPLFHRVMGYSYFAHSLGDRFFPNYWLLPLSRTPHMRSQEDPVAVSCHVLQLLNDYVAERGIRTLVLFQYAAKNTDLEMKRIYDVKQCLSRMTGLQVLDPWPGLEELQQSNPKEFQSLFSGHMTPKGNSWMAARIAEAIENDPVPALAK